MLISAEKSVKSCPSNLLSGSTLSPSRTLHNTQEESATHSSYHWYGGVDYDYLREFAKKIENVLEIL
jgi:hypothetical protein